MPIPKTLRDMARLFMYIYVDEVESATKLAEITADTLDHGEWIADETHWIWDDAMKIYTHYHGKGY